MPKKSPLVDTRVIYCGDNLDQLAKLPDACIDLVYIDPPFNSNRNYESSGASIQVKQKDKVGRPDIDKFKAVMMREKRTKGYFVAFNYTHDAEQECAAFHKRTRRAIKLITVQEILDGEHVQKL